MAEFDDLNVQGNAVVRGLQVTRALADCFFAGDAVSPAFINNTGFNPAFVRNGPGDYSLQLASDPGSALHFATGVLSLDGLPTVLTLTTVAQPPGGVRVLTNHLDGTFVDAWFALILTAHQ